LKLVNGQDVAPDVGFYLDMVAKFLGLEAISRGAAIEGVNLLEVHHLQLVLDLPAGFAAVEGLIYRIVTTAVA
jgi:hypothetical protein